MKVVYANFGQRNEYVSDSRSNEHYLKIPVQAWMVFKPYFHYCLGKNLLKILSAVMITRISVALIA